MYYDSSDALNSHSGFWEKDGEWEVLSISQGFNINKFINCFIAHMLFTVPNWDIIKASKKSLILSTIWVTANLTFIKV